MTSYVLRRFLTAALIIIGVSFLTFMFTRVVPSDPASMWVGPRATPEQIANTREELGLDKPIFVQYYLYVKGLVKGDLGTSLQTHQPVLRDISHYLPASLELIVVGMIIGLILGIPLGIISAVRNGSPTDHLIRLISIAGVALPTFWTAMIFQLLFFKYLGLLPLSGRVGMIIYSQPLDNITGLYLIDSLITGNFAIFSDAFLHVLLPSLTLAGYPLGLSARMIRAKLLEILGQDYITTARAVGMREIKVIGKYALKNSISPVLVASALIFPYSLVSTFLIESIFAWPGLGFYAARAIKSVDFPAIMAVTLLISFSYVVLNLLVDIALAFLDPRIRLD